MKQPKDLGIKIGTREESIWVRVRDESKELIKQSEDNLIIQKALLKLADENILLEQQKIREE